MRKLLLFFVLVSASCAVVNPESFAPNTATPPAVVTTVPSVQAPIQITTATPHAEKPAPSPAHPSAAPTRLSSPKPTDTLPPVRPLVLQVEEPADESIVNASSITVRGTTTSGAVVSVNGALASVDSNGAFQLTIALDEGPNVIEVVASDDAGNEAYSILSVIYQP
jgi:hypothetical protein